MTKLSELKVGDRFTVEAIVTSVSRNRTSFDTGGYRTNNHIYDPDALKNMEVIKLPDPVRDLVKGETIILSGSQITGEYLGKGWVWWSNEDRPHPLYTEATTEFYKVLKK